MQLRKWHPVVPRLKPLSAYLWQIAPPLPVSAFPDASPESLASFSFAHLLLGLMKADGTVTDAEQRKLEILAHKFRHGLPCAAEDVVSVLNELHDSQLHRVWKPQDHLDAGLSHFNQFDLTGDATADHARVALEMLDILAEVDGLTRSEELYLDQVRRAFHTRYGESALL